LVDRQSYRNAMARFGAAVNVVTSDGPAGRCGFTASAVCSVTDDPPTVLVCMNRSSDNNAAFKRNGVLCVNTLSGSQQALSSLFGGLTHDMATRFASADWTELSTGAPVLEGAIAAFDCRVAQVVEVGTHSVFFCEVEGVVFEDVHDGLIYFGRDYHRVIKAAG
jgi:flavin reductase